MRKQQRFVYIFQTYTQAPQLRPREKKQTDRERKKGRKHTASGLHSKDIQACIDSIQLVGANIKLSLNRNRIENWWLWCFHVNEYIHYEKWTNNLQCKCSPISAAIKTRRRESVSNMITFQCDATIFFPEMFSAPLFARKNGMCFYA